MKAAIINVFMLTIEHMTTYIQHMARGCDDVSVSARFVNRQQFSIIFQIFFSLTLGKILLCFEL